MKTQYKFIKFIPAGNDGTHDLWRCFTNRQNEELGYVGWEQCWHEFTFAPSAGTIFSASCLNDISNFLGQLNRPAQGDGNDRRVLARAHRRCHRVPRAGAVAV